MYVTHSAAHAFALWLFTRLRLRCCAEIYFLQEGVHRCRSKAAADFEKKFAGKNPDHSDAMAFMESAFKPCIQKHLGTVPSLIKQLK